MRIVQTFLKMKNIDEGIELYELRTITGKPKSLCASQQTVENSERDGNSRPPKLPLEKAVCRSGNNG